jgi:SAM-dependent methyltransferase
MGSDRSAAEWHLAHRAAERSFSVQARAAVSLLPPGPVLDLGCGTAPLTEYLDPDRNPWTGLERDAAMAFGAIRRRAPAPARVALGDAGRLPFRRRAFAGVTALGLFEYLPDPAAALREAARVTARGGAIVLTVPRRDSLYRRGLAAAAPLLRLAGRADPFDLEAGRRVTPGDLARWGRAAGVVATGIRPVAPALVPWPFDRLLGRAARRMEGNLSEHLGTAWLARYSCPGRGGGGE